MSESDSVHSDWSDWEEDTEEAPVQSLFSVARFATVEEALEHDKRAHGFDFISFRKQRSMGFHETIQIINYVRKHSNDDDLVGRLQTILIQEPGPWESEDYLVPVLDNDTLLSHDWEEGVDDEVDDEVDDAEGGEQRRRLQEVLGTRDAAAMDELQEMLASMFDERKTEEEEKNGSASRSTATKKQSENKEVDQAYFESYSSFDIHQQMLADKPRTEAYRRALEQNPTLIAGKTVVDVGCGTGILSMFAARGGAGRVVGVEASSAMVAVARSNVEASGLSDRVSIVCTKAEDLKLKEDDFQADVIVSEWMGYALLFETMLDSVLHVRDRFLKPGGAVLPDLLTIKVAGASAKAADFDFWDDVYGFAMPEIGKKVRQAAQKEALVRIVPPDSLVTEPLTARTLDIVTMAPEDQDFRVQLSLPKKCVPLGNDSQLACMVLWFDAEFSRRFCDQRPVLLDTSPAAPATHWAQTVLTLKTPVDLGAPGVKGLHVALGMTRATDKHRQLDISLQTAVWHEDDTHSPADLLTSSAAQTQLFTMAVKQ